MKPFYYLRMVLIFAFSCNSPLTDVSLEVNEILSEEIEADPLSLEQEEALDALDQIQMSGGGYLYSTFPGIDHRFLPEDTSFTITSEELHIAIDGLLEKYYDHIPIEKRNELSRKASLVDKEYLVLGCYGFHKEPFKNVSEEVPISGKWILPEVLSLRDVVIFW